MQKRYDIQTILNYLPHRYPFILIDRVIELEAGKKIRALKNVTINEPYFQGHFPGNPIMPGVLIIEAMAQAGGVLALESMSPEERSQLVYFMALDKVRFRKPVVPGDQLLFEVNLLKMRKRAIKAQGIATVENNIVAEAELMASFGGHS
jgi:beta-hydroxyacyl-ACP dehydratase FabZ